MTSVLVVDDSLLDQKVVMGILDRCGMTVACVSNGQEALDYVADQRPDLVLTDLQMPVMDGLILVRELKSLYPGLPVILATGAGSEEIAVEALQVGASSYVPKRNLATDLERVLNTVLASTTALHEKEQVRNLLQHSENYYILGYEPSAPQALINNLQEGLAYANIGDESDWQRVGIALAEALTNAIDHGNLELDSQLREDDGIAYGEIRNQRIEDPRYRDRRVHVTSRMTKDEATFIIRDEGGGFNPQNLPDPTDPENLTKPTGRGVLLIRTFMDEVKFNDKGNEITMIKRKVLQP